MSQLNVLKFFILTYTAAPIGESGESCGTEFSFENACNLCGTGTELKENLKVRGISKTKKDLFETLDGDMLISDNLLKKIKETLPSFELYPVTNTKSQTQNFYHLYSAATLPKFKNSSTGYTLENQCIVCKRDGYFNDVIFGETTIVKPLVLRYQTEKILPYSHSIILKTWECMGNSNKLVSGKKVVHYARPLIVIREDLKSILEADKIKNIDFEHIIIE